MSSTATAADFKALQKRVEALAAEGEKPLGFKEDLAGLCQELASIRQQAQDCMHNTAISAAAMSEELGKSREKLSALDASTRESEKEVTTLRQVMATMSDRSEASSGTVAKVEAQLASLQDEIRALAERSQGQAELMEQKPRQIGEAVEELQQQLEVLRSEVVQRRLEQLSESQDGQGKRLGQLEEAVSKHETLLSKSVETGSEPPLKDTVSQLAKGVLKMAQLLGASSEDAVEKLGWREACADLARMIDHTWLRCRLPRRASILKLLRSKADAETVRELQHHIESLGGRLPQPKKAQVPMQQELAHQLLQQMRQAETSRLGAEQLQQVAAEAIQSVLGQHSSPLRQEPVYGECGGLPPRPPAASTPGRRPSPQVRSHSPAAGFPSPAPPTTYRSVDSPKVRQMKAAAAAAAAAALAAQEDHMHMPTEAWSECSEPDMDGDVGRPGWY